MRQRHTPASSIFVHDCLASRDLAQAPAKAGFDGWADSMVAPNGCPQGHSLDRPQSGGRGSLAGQRIRRRCLARGQGRAVRRKRPVGSCGFLARALSGLLGGIGLLPPDVRLLREDCCPRFRESRSRRLPGALIDIWPHYSSLRPKIDWMKASISSSFALASHLGMIELNQNTYTILNLPFQVYCRILNPFPPSIQTHPRLL